jgi:hypothetical protein
MVLPIYLSKASARKDTGAGCNTLSGDRILSSLSIGALDVAGVNGSSLWQVRLCNGPTDGLVIVEGGVLKIERGVSILVTGIFLSAP